MEIFKEGAQINLDDEDNIFINTYDGELIELRPPRYRSGIN